LPYTTLFRSVHQLPSQSHEPGSEGSNQDIDGERQARGSAAAGPSSRSSPLMEFARQEYLWLLLVIPFVILFWGIGLWHRGRMRSRFGNLANLQAISRISWSGREWFRG